MTEGQRIGERRLGAIMFTDLVGYSSITELDENRALRLLDEHRLILQSVFPKFEGRIVKTMGDAFLVEFASAVEAVNCAVEIQNQLAAFNSNRGSEEKVFVRIGIHVGDIVHSGDDVLGDAVNVAARVEPIAEPGGICVTRQVADQIEGKVKSRLVSLGTRELKNIIHPVELFRVVPTEGAPQLVESRAMDPRRIAVLPFANLSGDPDDRYFVDGMTEELISTVSKIGELSVISRTSVMRYKDTTLSIGQIGRELSVGSVLEGSVRKAGNRVRITVELVDTGSDRHIWSQSYERDLTDVFAIQGDIAQQVAESLKIRLLSEDRQSLEKKATKDAGAYTLYLKGRFFWNERYEDEVRKAIGYFSQAVKVDPTFALAYSGLADCYLVLSDYAFMAPMQAASLARDYAVKALEIDDELAEAHASLGLTLLNFSWDFDNAEREFKRAIELKPNYATAHHWHAVQLWQTRRYDEACAVEERAVELDPYARAYVVGLGLDLMVAGRGDEAMKQFDRAVDLFPEYPVVRFWRSHAYVSLLRVPEAVEEARRAVELDRTRNTSMRLNLAWVLSFSGQVQEARKIVEEVLSEAGKVYFSPSQVALVELGLGNSDEGYHWLQKAYNERDGFLLSFASLPWLQRYRSDPRWLEIERGMGFAKMQ